MQRTTIPSHMKIKCRIRTERGYNWRLTPNQHPAKRAEQSVNPRTNHNVFGLNAVKRRKRPF